MVLYLAVTETEEQIRLKALISGVLVLALGVILAYHFALFWIQGHVIIAEPNKAILSLETLMSLGIVVFGVERLLRAK